MSSSQLHDLTRPQLLSYIRRLERRCKLLFFNQAQRHQLQKEESSALASLRGGTAAREPAAAAGSVVGSVARPVAKRGRFNLHVSCSPIFVCSVFVLFASLLAHQLFESRFPS